MMDKAII